MGPERTTALVLMDLWAFAYGQDHSPRTRREFETVCRMAERLGLPEARLYRNFVAGIDGERRWRNRPSRADQGQVSGERLESLLPN